MFIPRRRFAAFVEHCLESLIAVRWVLLNGDIAYMSERERPLNRLSLRRIAYVCEVHHGAKCPMSIAKDR